MHQLELPEEGTSITLVYPAIADAIMDRIIYNAYISPLDSKRPMRQVMAEDLKDRL